MYYRRIISLLLVLFMAKSQAFEIKGKVQVNALLTDSPQTFLDSGTGTLRFDKDAINLQQSVVHIEQSILSEVNFSADVNYYQDGEQHIGLSQAQLAYKPLSNSAYRWRMRAGFFYPKMSLENVDVGWLSPYSYTQSAINSWIGEELRTPGIEITVYSPGRVRRSPWSWELHLGAYKGNDPLGTLISWRGFATHDRQTLNNERVQFAPYPTVIQRDLIWHPAWVEPFHEIDGKLGYYVGAHLEHFKSSKIRYYFYDNLANPTAVNHQRLYAWRTRFHSLALQHDISDNTRILAQLLSGDTEMGERFVVVDFDAYFIMFSHKLGASRFSIRYDNFDVDEDDILPQDPNNSDGQSITLALRRNIDKHWQAGVEYHYNKNTAQNRSLLGQNQLVIQQQAMVVVQYSF